MKSEAYKGHLAMLMANVLWGCMSPSSKIVLSSGLINAISLTTFRMLGAAIVFWIASIFTRKEHVPHEDLKHLFFAALFGIVFNQGTYIFGVSQTSPIDATIVASMGEVCGPLRISGRCPDAYSERTANGGNRKRQQ